MFSITSLFTIALAGGASAFTPTGFEPASTDNLTVAYGSKLATNGIKMLRADTATTPILGTTTKLTGTYTIMMVDPDIPPALAKGGTTEFLHWMQSDLTSANTTTTIDGQEIFELINVRKTPAFATYLQPSPPNMPPVAHRYTQLLLNTTRMNMSLALLQMAGVSRGNFSAVDVVKNAKVEVVGGEFFCRFVCRSIGVGWAGVRCGSWMGSCTFTMSDSGAGLESGCPPGGIAVSCSYSISAAPSVARVRMEQVLLVGGGAPCGIGSDDCGFCAGVLC